MTQDNSGDKPKKPSSAPPPINPLPSSLSDVRGGAGMSALQIYRSKSLKPPDWQFWTKIRAVRVWQAVALSLNIDPDSMKHSSTAWMAGPGGDPIFEDRSFPSDSAKIQYDKRLRLVKPEITNSDYFHLHTINSNRAQCEIYLKHFAAWSLSIDLGEMPPELVAIAQSPNATQSQQAPDSQQPPDDWKVKAKKIADHIGSERWGTGQRQITARNIAAAVTLELAKDTATHGNQGQRGEDNVRNEGLKGWKFTPPPQ